MESKFLLNKLVQKEDLTINQSKDFLMQMMKSDNNAILAGAIITALRMKGETVNEIIGFIQALRENMVKISVKNAIDVCGTGGDGKGTFNISTAVSFVVAGCGVKVAKHGNKAASSQCGSADVLKELGVKIDLQPTKAEKVLEKVGMVFLFAPVYNPSFKHVSLIRKELGIRTIFNFLGPFANPASVKHQLIGVPNIEIAEKLAIVATKLGYIYLDIVTSEDGMDEISTRVKTHVFEICGQRMTRNVINPKDFGFKERDSENIQGGSALQNAEIIQDILKGQKGIKRDTVILNSALVLKIAGKVKKISDGITLAEKSIDTGKARKILKNLIEETQKYA